LRQRIPFVGAQEERLAANEALFREVNERVAEIATHFVDVETANQPVDFTCECRSSECARPIQMTLAEYDRIRAESTHFAVAPGHEQPEIETIIERYPTYVVVAKRDEEAKEVARKTDPRA
jgi:hypothetical protein